jgi:hypothetical protein
MTAGAAGELTGFFFEGEHAVDHVPCALNQSFRDIGRFDGMGRPIEELLSQFVFELLKTSAERRLSDVMLPGRLYEAAESVERLEVLKLFQLHAANSPRRPVITRFTGAWPVIDS